MEGSGYWGPKTYGSSGSGFPTLVRADVTMLWTGWMEQDEEERGEKLETPLYEEDIIEGFSFCSFHTYSGLEVLYHSLVVILDLQSHCYLCTVCLIGTTDFDAQVSGIKFWEGDENLRLVNNKKVYEIRYRYWVVACILDSLVHKKYTLTFLWDKNFFFLNWLNGDQKVRLFLGTDLKSVHLTLVESAPKKSSAKKTDT